MTPEELDALRAKGDPYAFGALPSTIDTRDHAFAPGATAAPASYMHPGVKRVPVLSQQGATCVGNSIATCLSLMQFSENAGEITPFNGELMNARVVGKAQGQWAAAMPRDVLQDVLDHGAATFAGDKGLDMYFPASYAAVDHSSIDAVKAAISSGPGTTVTAACWLLSNFPDPSNGYSHDIPGETPWGYHELSFVGYDDQGVTVQNTWDTWWGDAGFARFAWDYVNTTRISEMWAITDASDATGGHIGVWDAPPEANTGRVVRKGTSAAVYLLETGGRLWVQSLAMAKQMGVNMGAVQSLAPTAWEWDLPVIGPDAPMQYQG